MTKSRERIARFARRNRFYPLWRAWRERQQLARFNRLMERVAASRAFYDERSLVELLRARGPQRRPLPDRPGIAAFGQSVWEDNGLWQALRARGEFTLFDYGAVSSGGRSSEVRRGRGREFLEHVRRRDAEGKRVDVVFLYASGEHIDPEMIATLKRSGIWTILLSLDDKQQMVDVRTGDLHDWQIEAARAVDFYWTTWRAGADWLIEQGVNAWYAPGGADPDIFSPRERDRDIDVLWLGSAYGLRMQLVSYLRGRGFSLQAFGSGWGRAEVSADQMLDLYARSRVVLGMGGVGQTDRVKHLKGRDFEVPMSGSVYLTSFNPELPDWYRIGTEILCYSSFEECAEVLSWILRRPDVAAQIRVRARERSVRDHTWAMRFDRIFQLLRGDVAA